MFSQEPVKKLLGLLRLRLNSGVRYKGKNYCWDNALQLKIRELARHLLGRAKELDLRDQRPDFYVEGHDELRERILALTVPKA